MLALADPRAPLPEPLLDAPGGFLWWYADLTDQQGSGLVLIFSFGLPFLPGLADGARRGRPALPRACPSVNVAVYQRGKLDFYLLQELAQPEARWSPGAEEEEWSFGRSQMRSVRAGGRRRFTASLSLEVPSASERLSGELEVEGPDRTPDAPPEAGPHLWSPLTGPASGRASLSMGPRWSVSLAGEAYLDRNGGDRPLHEMGIQEWSWGRATVGDAQWIYYLLTPRDPAAPAVARVLRVGPDGQTERMEGVEARSSGWRPGVLGPAWASRINLRWQGRELLSVRQRPPVDAGPFYLRLPVELELPGGERGRGWGEQVWPDRVDLARHRPFVEMRVHRPGRPNSMWLPLFTGPSAGRIGRLLGVSS